MENTTGYVECAGVRVPQGLTKEELLEMLEKRGVRFSNESDIQAAFGVFLETQANLRRRIEALKGEEAGLVINHGKLQTEFRKLSRHSDAIIEARKEAK